MIRQYRQLEPNEFLVAGYDMAMGGGDYSACVFISKTKNDIPIIYHAQETATIATNNILPLLERIYQQTKVKPVIAPETNAGGTYEIDRMLNSTYINNFSMYKQRTGVGQTESPDSKKYGWNTNSITRPKMLEELKNTIDNKLLGIYDEPLINEMFAFVVNKTLSGWKAQAEYGSHDDLIIGTAIAHQLYQTESIPIQQNYGIKNDFSKWSFD